MHLALTDADRQPVTGLPPLRLNSGQDVILIEEQVETVGLENIRLTRGWEELAYSLPCPKTIYQAPGGASR